ncbi:MAG: phytanoyl-CoA dioxygenase family protein [Bacteroidota bacterium]
MFDGTYDLDSSTPEFFQANGYAETRNVLTADEVRAVRDAMEDVIAQRKAFARDLGGDGAGQAQILQMLNLWEQHPVLEQYVRSPRISGIAKQLAGSSELRLFHDQALVKPAHSTKASPWHQDQPYWPSKEGGMFSCWMALDDVIIERGAMQFIAGSHKWGEFDPISFGGDGPALTDLIDEEQKAAWNPVPVELKAGDCTWHHGLTFHFTRPNSTDHVRRAFVTIYIPDGITYAAGEKMEHPLSETITSQKGEPLRGSKFIQVG